MIAIADRPGFRRERMLSLARAAVARCGLDLTGMTVLTEAATGAYAVTAVLAAMAGAARVHAVAKDGAHATAADARAETEALAAAAGLSERVRIHEGDARGLAEEVDLVTNSGHVRPIDEALIRRLPPHAVVALMYEAWEFRPGDVDLAACAVRRIPVVAVNERHPSVDVFSYLGPLAVRHLHDAGIPVRGNRIAILCDNPFARHLEDTIRALGAEAIVTATADGLPDGGWDAILVALHPRRTPALDAADARRLSDRFPGTVIIQFWGDLDREAALRGGLPVWPPVPPRPGHMAVLLPAIGPDPVIRLQAGGLRAAEWVFRHGPSSCPADGIAVPLDAARLPASASVA